MTGTEDEQPEGAPPPSPPPPAPPADEARTVFSPSIPPAAPPPAPAADPSFTSAPPPAPSFTEAPGFSAPPPGEPRQIKPGDVLNHIFEVRRFIARGGMGEVFEGVNVSSEERVAIKVILPHLAADPAVQAMFRKEARTLTRLNHPGLVQYRVLAQEPQLGVFYIVTDYIDGQNLSDILGQLDTTPADITALMRRLCEGLAVAHSLGAIHRDISPDNIMLEGGRLDRARVIDFGIAKDLDAGSQTIVGDGFAGKLNYVAPEQLGDFDRTVGPWTDIYSLGLTMLAVMGKRDVNMGGTLVDAVDKRRAGPDLGVVPEELRPVLSMMLRPNPAERLRSMEEVLGMLGGGMGTMAPTAFTSFGAGAGAPPPPPPPPKKQDKPARGSGDTIMGLPKMAVFGGAGVLALLVAGGLYMALAGGGEEVPAPVEQAAAPAGGDPVATAQAALARGLASISCSWLDATDVGAEGNNVAAAFSGIAGDPVQAQNQIAGLLQGAGLRAASMDLSKVTEVRMADCAPLDAFRQIRSAGAQHMTSAQAQYEMNVLPEGSEYAGKLGAPAVVEIDTGGVQGDFALIGYQDDGEMFLMTNSRQQLEQFIPTEVRPGVRRLEADTEHKGWAGIIMLKGQGPFDEAMFTGTAASRAPDWQQQFLAKARAQGWQSELVWYELVDQQPNK